MSRQSLAGTVTLVVPEYPSREGTLRYRNREMRGRRIQYALSTGTKCTVYLPGTLIEKWYPESNAGWYLKISGAVNVLDLKFILSFLKLYGQKEQCNSRDSGTSLNILTKLGEGVSCKDNCVLQEAVVHALALRITETKLGPTECVSCHRVTPYGSLPCEHEYIHKICAVEKLRRELR